MDASRIRKKNLLFHKFPDTCGRRLIYSLQFVTTMKKKERKPDRNLDAVCPEGISRGCIKSKAVVSQLVNAEVNSGNRKAVLVSNYA